MPSFVVCFVHLKIDHIVIKVSLLNFEWLYNIAVYGYIIFNSPLLDIFSSLIMSNRRNYWAKVY